MHENFYYSVIHLRDLSCHLGAGLVFLLAHTIMAGPVIYGLEFQVPSTLDALYTLACNTCTLCRLL